MQIRKLLADQHNLWILAILFYVVGGGMTTMYGIGQTGVEEAGIVALVFFETFGPAGFLVLKLLIVGPLFLCWYYTDSIVRVAIPAAIFASGLIVVSWNLAIIGVAL